MHFHLSIVERKKWLFMCKLPDIQELLQTMARGWYAIHVRNRHTAGLKVKWTFIFRQRKENNHMWRRSG